jgi:hypothetical protein
VPKDGQTDRPSDKRFGNEFYIKWEKKRRKQSRQSRRLKEEINEDLDKPTYGARMPGKVIFLRSLFPQFLFFV